MSSKICFHFFIFNYKWSCSILFLFCYMLFHAFSSLFYTGHFCLVFSELQHHVHTLYVPLLSLPWLGCQHGARLTYPRSWLATSTGLASVLEVRYFFSLSLWSLLSSLCLSLSPSFFCVCLIQHFVCFLKPFAHEYVYIYTKCVLTMTDADKSLSGFDSSSSQVYCCVVHLLIFVN